ncbi:GGDEF domain-containing protein [Rhodoferax sp. GW822-FHT02A01]|uniref:GGDEF domain-containing protein n=1 Tax=Rhodoferax sp. GW822-FHT02A01 TaxID=3141537 RepID=UPI00315C8F37
MKQQASEHPDKRAELALVALDHIDAMIAFWDRDQRCQFANRAYYDWFGRSVDQMAGISMRDLLGPLYAKNLPYILKAMAGEKQVFEREITLPDGDVRFSLATYTPHIVQGVVEGIYAHVVDVSKLKHLENELRMAKAAAEELATHDFLTGLPNRLLLNDRIVQALSSARRSGQIVAGISLDLDSFKKVNDHYGHATGDQLLVQVGSRITGALRENDTVTRMGGDEFFVLIGGTESVVQVENMAQRILDSFQKPFQLSEATLFVTCSLGVAVCSHCSIEPGQLIQLSDHGLLKAKELGKNRYVMEQLSGPSTASQAENA